MNTPFRSVFQTQQISPRSVGYSYLPGSAIASVHAPVLTRTFGTAASPQPGISPIPGGRTVTSPQNIGSSINTSPTSVTSRVVSGLFA